MVLRATEPVAVRDPEIEGRIHVLDPKDVYDENDPMVKAYGWAFQSDEDIEVAVNEPGKPRRSRKPRAAKAPVKKAAKQAAKVETRDEEPTVDPPEDHGPITTDDDPANVKTD